MAEVVVDLCPACTAKFEAYQSVAEAFDERFDPILVGDLCPACAEEFEAAARAVIEAEDEL